MALEEYKKKSLKQQILDEPDTFVGGSDEIDDNIPVFILNDITVNNVKYIPAILKLYDEILVNARDQKIRLDESKDENVIKTTEIKVSYNSENQSWSVYNNGNGIDVAEHPTEKDQNGNPQWIVEMILGELLTSKNYNKSGKTTGGKNGFGAKLTNLFSSWFRVETVDHIRGLKYIQEFTENMSKKTKPNITKVKCKPYTKIEWITDFNRFNVKGYSEDMINIMTRRVYDLAGTTDKSVSVSFNSKKLSVKSFDKYIYLYLNKEKLVYEKIHDRWEIGLATSISDKFEQYSFVNGIFTQKGGKHVDYITKQITNKLISYIEKKYKKTIPEHYIKNYMKIFINCVIEDPGFESQSKERLITSPSKFGSKPLISDKFIKKILETINIVEKVLSFAEFKQNKDFKKTDGVKKNKIIVDKLDDANWAGTAKSDTCTLILTEGDSAKTMAVSGLSVVGRDKFGVFPLRGKVLNVKEASKKQISDNTEITNLKKILGLESNKEYTDTKRLRYGNIMIMTDQDHDGSHIKGLVILIFETLWPSLLKLNYITSMITPLIKVTNKKNQKCFYNMSDYEHWKKTTDNYKNYTCKYYKGLGTSTTNEAKEYFKTMKITNYICNKNTKSKMNLAFKKELADSRKQWLYNYNPDKILDNNITNVGIDNFIDYELIHFSNSDTRRSIGCVYDGLKPSQRKILYCCLKRKLFKEIRVAQLAGYVSEHAAYHHGEASLQSTIIGMAQTFIGSNNINLLQPNGQFGSRIMGGSDAASPRYIHTELNPIINILFPQSDTALLKRVDDDGILVEPVYYVPIIPIVLVNGMKGIGTGFSTDIPQFNPLEIINNIRNKLSDKSYSEMIPWYKNFTGIIKQISDCKFITKGKYDILSENKIKITELPIGTWTSNYKKFLDNSIIDKKDKSKTKFILDYEDHSTDDKVEFIIKMNTNISQYIVYDDKTNMDTIEKLFKLTSTKTTSNIHLYDKGNHIKKYKYIKDIIDDFCKVRLDLYCKRKDYLLEELQRKTILESSKLKFIEYVIEDKIVVYKNSHTNIVKSLQQNELPYIVNGIVETKYTTQSYNYLTTIPIRDFTQEKIDELKKRVENLEKEHNILEKKTVKSMWLEELDQLEKQL
tara:strand:+ start:896 stop:4246 length:3351 start_codon:yes stop_codon:yes gene_type:complete